MTFLSLNKTKITITVKKIRQNWMLSQTKAAALIFQHGFHGSNSELSGLEERFFFFQLCHRVNKKIIWETANNQVVWFRRNAFKTQKRTGWLPPSFLLIYDSTQLKSSVCCSYRNNSFLVFFVRSIFNFRSSKCSSC